MSQRAAPPQNQAVTLLYTAMFGYLYSMLASTVILGRPVLGGALYMVGRVTVLFSRLTIRGDFKRLPNGLRHSGIILGILCALFALGILLVYPLAVDLPALWLVFALACLVLLMGELTDRMDSAQWRLRVNRVRRGVRLVEVMLLFAGVCALILFVTMPSPAAAWHLLGGFALCCLLQGIVLLTRRGKPETVIPAEESTENTARLEGFSHQYQRLTQVNAYKTFRTVMMICITALQVTLFLMYTFIGVSSHSLLLSLAIAFVCIVLAHLLTDLLLLRSQQKRQAEPATVLIIGLSLWMVSLVSFALYTQALGMIWRYLALAFCTSGVTMASNALSDLEKDMRVIVRFTSGKQPETLLSHAHQALLEYSTLIGGMIALVTLALVTLLSGGSIAPQDITLTTQPLLLLPALALVVAAIPAAFRIPLERGLVQKMRTFLQLTENGETNLPLQKQLEDSIIKVRKRRYGVKLVILILRPFFYSKVIGADRVRQEPGTSLVFTCNHGELYGPIVTNLFIPISFRPWVIDEIAQPDETPDYLYQNTVKRQKWIPKRLKWPAAKLVSDFLAWATRSLDSIPVYRDNPRELVNTFRLTAQAMEAGDNILIFPENPNDDSLPTPGYVKEGVGPFFTGFAMVAQIYYQRTGKRTSFYPIFADKHRRTLTFGQPVQYDPATPPALEKQRIADHLQAEMQRICEENSQQQGAD